MKAKLISIHNALSSALGDIDPYLPDDMTDEEVMEEEPVFWAAQQIALLIGDGPWDVENASRQDAQDIGGHLFNVGRGQAQQG